MIGPWQQAVLDFAEDTPADAALCAMAETVVRERNTDTPPGSERFYALVLHQVLAWRRQART